MRITSLSRKLGVSRDEIISFLKSKDISVPEGINAKIDESDAQLAIEYFGEKIEESESTPQIEAEDDNTTIENVSALEKEVETLPEIKEEKKTESKPKTKTKEKAKTKAKKVPSAKKSPEKKVKAKKDKEAKVEVTEVEPDHPMPADDESLEDFLEREEVKIIKAKKVKLEGVKVVGKIDLPEPPPPKEKKVESEQKEEVEEDKKEEKEKKPRGLYEEYIERNTRKSRPKRQRRAPKRELSFEEKQEQERRKLEREKLRRQKELKKKKELHYEQKVKSKIQPKTKPIKKEEAVPEITKKEIKASKPIRVKTEKAKTKAKKNLVGKFWSWLNGEYDKF